MDLGTLAGLTGLASLHLECLAKVPSLAPLSHLTGLTKLHLRDLRGDVDLGPLARLTGLTTLNLTLEDGVVDLSPLTNLAGLATLRLDVDDVHDLSNVAALPNLADLVIGGGLKYRGQAQLTTLASCRPEITIHM